MCEYIKKKPNLGHFFKKGGKNKKNMSQLILKNVKEEFEFALRVGDINECMFKILLWSVGAYFFLQIFEKISYILNYITSC